MNRALLSCALLAAACGGHPTVAAKATPPRLVVLLVIDQLPQWAFEAKRPALHGGFDRLLTDGEWHTGHYPYASTLTAPGHTLLGSGRTPSESGIIANEWFDRATQARVKATQDGSGFSSHYSRVAGLGDAMAAGHTGGKAVSVSLKDRAALLPLGHHGLAIYYDKTTFGWGSSEPRAWLAGHLAAHPIESRLAEAWVPLDAAELARLTGTTDDQKGEVGEKRFGPTFPHLAASTVALGGNPGEAVYALPLGNTIALEMASDAIAKEQLGTDASPDLLVVSLSANDYVNHGWGHESWESWDMTIRLDADLQAFLASLDTQVGAGRWALVATSDHGASPLPDRHGGGRYTHDAVEVVANKAAQTVWGDGVWARVVEGPYVFLTATAHAKPAAEQARAIAAILAAVRAMPGIGRADETAPLEGHCETRTGDEQAICLSLDPERSGEVAFWPAKYWITEETDERNATAHGSLWAYDREVPVIVIPPRAPGSRPTHAPLTAPDSRVIEMTDISTTVATWLGIPAPRSL